MEILFVDDYVIVREGFFILLFLVFEGVVVINVKNV